MEVLCIAPNVTTMHTITRVAKSYRREGISLCLHIIHFVDVMKENAPFESANEMSTFRTFIFTSADTDISIRSQFYEHALYITLP